jgi:two-component system, LytTR family, response regulator
MTITCAIIEQEPLARELLERYVARIPALALKWVRESVDELDSIEPGQEHAADILFLDVFFTEVPGKKPASNLDRCRGIEKYEHIIVTTAYPLQFIKSLSLPYIGMLNKPVTFTNFLKTVEDAIALIEGKKKG